MPSLHSHGQNAVTGTPSESVQRRFESTGTPVAVVAEIVASKSQIAVPMQYRLAIETPAGAKVNLPPIGGVAVNETKTLAVVDQPFGDFLLTGIQMQADLPLDGRSGKRLTQMVLEMETLKSGIRQTPPLEIVYRLAADDASVLDGDREGTISIPSLGIEIGSVLKTEDTPDDFRDLKGVIATSADPAQKTGSVFVFVFLLVGGAVVVLAVFWWFRRNRVARPDEWASQRIAEVQQAYQGSQLNAVEVYDELSLVLRNYVELACQTPANAMCTAEFLEDLKRNGFDPEVIADANSILSQADLNKFSHGSGMLPGNAGAVFDQARTVVHEGWRLNQPSMAGGQGKDIDRVQREFAVGTRKEA